MTDSNSEPPAKKKILHYGSLEGKVGASGADSIQKGMDAGNINISDPSKCPWSKFFSRHFLSIFIRIKTFTFTNNIVLTSVITSSVFFSG